MEWMKVSIATTAQGIDPVSGRLLELGMTGLEIADKDDFREFLESNRASWDYVDEELERLKDAETTVTLYLSKGAAGLEQLAAVQASMAELKALDSEGVFGRLAVECSQVEDQDWSENWKKYFHPIPVGKKVLIQPAWEAEQDPRGRIPFVVNPGMSFGTGSHPSTRFCIEAIEEQLRPGDRMLDLGCGSGILSIIALLLGAKEADAVDIDPNAVDVAYGNLALNGLDRERYHVYAGDILNDTSLRNRFGKYEVVAANIVADVIIQLSAFVRQFMKPNGVFVCSGIILERLEEVKAALKAAGFTVEKEKKDRDWAALTCR